MISSKLVLDHLDHYCCVKIEFIKVLSFYWLSLRPPFLGDHTLVYQGLWCSNMHLGDVFLHILIPLVIALKSLKFMSLGHFTNMGQLKLPRLLLWDSIIHPRPNLHDSLINPAEVRTCKGNYTPLLNVDVILYPCCNPDGDVALC